MLRTDSNFIPGTDRIILNDKNNEDLVKDDGIVLIPQPSASPNDPLMWNKWRKGVQLALILLITGLTAATSNSPSAAQEGIQADNPQISRNVFDTADGILFLGIGWGSLLSAPTVYLWGSRLGYLLSIVVSIIGCVWYANCHRDVDVVVSQLFIGASESVTEAVAQLSITQVFFQHQATHFIGVYVLAISVGTYMGPLISGFVANNLGWRWVGYLGAICSGFTGLLILFGLEETYFDRKHFLAMSETVHVSDNVSICDKQSTSSEKRDIEKANDTSITDVVTTTDLGYTGAGEYGQNRNCSAPMESFVDLQTADESQVTCLDPPRTYWQRIAFITPATNLKGLGIKQYCKRIFLCLKVLAFPSVLYSGLQWGAQDAWLSFYNDMESEYYYHAPWNYSDAGVAIMNVPCLIGASIGCFYGAWMSDWFVMWRAQKNGGVREAESRLWCLLPAGIISPIGMILFGAGTEHEWRWPTQYVGLGMVGFGWGCCGDLSMSYLVDCYPDMVLEGMVGVSLINNNIAMIFSFIVSRWLAAIGPQNTMICTAVLNFVFVFLSLPMIYYGKRCRLWTRDMYIRFIDARDSLDSTS